MVSSWIETDPGTALLFVAVIAFILLGLLTLSGLLAQLIWVFIILVVAFVVYFAVVRFVRWGLGKTGES